LLVWSVAPALGLRPRLGSSRCRSSVPHEMTGALLVHWVELIRLRSRKVALSCSVTSVSTYDRELKGYPGSPSTIPGMISSHSCASVSVMTVPSAGIGTRLSKNTASGPYASALKTSRPIAWQ